MPDSTARSPDAAAYLAAVVDSSDDAIITKNLSGVIQSWNQAAERIFGYTAQEAIGHPMLLIIPPELHEGEAGILARLLNGERIDQYETVRRRKDGRLIDIALTVSPVRDAQGTIIGASKIARDISERKQTQQTLEEAESRLAVTLDSIGDAVLATDTESQVTYVNRVAEQLLGYSSRQIMGQPLSKVFRIVNQETRRPVGVPWNGCYEKASLSDWPITPCFSVRTVQNCLSAPIKASDGRILGVVLVFRDLSDRRHASRQAALLSSIVASSDDAILSKDLSGTVTSWNRGAEQMFGYAASEMIGSSILQIIPRERHAEEAGILARLRRGERIEHYETLRRKKDGQFCDVSLTVSPLTDEDGRIIGASKIARDITEQKRGQRALHESQERWRVTLESIGDAVVATDAHGVVTFANAVAAELLGRSTTDIIGRPLTEVFKIVNEETRQPVDSPVDRVIREGTVVGLANHTVVVRPDHTEVPIDDSAAPIRDREGRLVGVVLVFRDITARKLAQSQLQRWSTELEDRVRQRTQELVRSQKRLRGLASQLSLTEQRERRRLATNLHDFLAQLLALARIKLSQAKQRLKGEPAGTESPLNEMDDILQQCLRFTRTLMAQLSPSVLQDLGLIPALKWLAEQMGQQGLKVEVQVLTDEEPRFGESQADVLFQSVRELLLNVQKHAGVLEAVISVNKQGNDVWLITVLDRGTGFDPTAVHYRPSGEHFGLFSIQERMEAMSGWCVIDSMPGRGTRVELGLAATAQTGTSEPHIFPAVLQEAESRKAAQRSHLRVLLVDDHAMIRQGLRSILETYADLEVVAEAADGEEAVRCALKEQPDVIVMDVNLPKLNGIDATKRIKQVAPHVHIIGLSVHTSPQTITALLEAGAATLLSKEQAADDLYRTIRRLLG